MERPEIKARNILITKLPPGVKRLLHVSKENIAKNAEDLKNDPDCAQQPCYIVKEQDADGQWQSKEFAEVMVLGPIHFIYQPNSDLGTVAYGVTRAAMICLKETK